MTIRSLTNLLTLLAALAGGVVATVLTYEEYHPKADIGCSRFGGDCTKTLKSSYGHLGPIPTSLFGLGMYLTVGGLCVDRHKALRKQRSRAGVRNAADSFTADSGKAAGEGETAAGAAGSLPTDPPPALYAEAAEYAAAAGQALPGDLRAKRLDAVLWVITLSAAVISWWLQYVSLGELCSFCPWCFTSAALATLMTLLTSYDFLLAGRKLEGEQRLLAGISAFILVCFGFVATPVVMARIRTCGPAAAAPVNDVNTPGAVNDANRKLIVADHLKFRGSATAKYTLVEFADYQCPHCKLASVGVEKLLKSPPKGGVRFAFRNFPLEQHGWALPAAMATEAAGEQGKFWEMHDIIFAHQEDLAKTDFSRERFDQWAEQLKLNIKKFNTDYDSARIADRIAKDHVAAELTGLVYTPSFYLVTPTQVTRLSGFELLERVWHDPNSPYWH